MKCLKVEDALSYLDQVKARFAGQEAIYHDFLDVMREFKTQKIGTEAVIHRVRELFEGHPDLIGGFNTFIPQGYRMDTPTSRIINTVGSVRSTLAFSTLDNVSPMKPLASLKSADPTEWASSCLASTISVLQPDANTFGNAAAATVQPLISPSHQENIPNPGVRVSSIATAAAAASGVTQAYQQQQQAQSFNHALHYVNKVKNRFQGTPDVYKRFLDILQWYQKEQRHSDPHRRKQAEQQVFQDVAKLFGGQDDLLQEFSQFLPESSGVAEGIYQGMSKKLSAYCQPVEMNVTDLPVHVPQVLTRGTEGVNFALSPSRQRHDSLNNSSAALGPSLDSKKLKRLAPATTTTGGSSVKKARPMCDVSLVDVNQLATGMDTELLHMIRVSLDADSSSGNRSYQTFLQNLALFNRSLLSADELLMSTRPLFPRHPDVWRRFCDLIAAASPTASVQQLGHSSPDQDPNPNLECKERDKYDRDKRVTNGISSTNSPAGIETDPAPEPQQQLSAGHATNNMLSINPSFMSLINEITHKRLDLDFSRLRSCGTSYRALPANFPQSRCSGRLKCPIAKEVLNNSFISFSSLTSEDSQFVSSKKNQYEENMYRVEDERYEVDMVTELNRDAMKNLVVVKRKMDRMTNDELNHYHLDDDLGGTSAILMRKAIHRVYGDKAGEVIHGLKTCPNRVIPVVILRMGQKDAEWREAIRLYQRSWAEQDARNYLRSLDHQGGTFKQRDAPLVRSKTMISQIETIAQDDKHFTQSCRSSSDPVGDMIFASLTQPCLATRTDLNCPGTIGSALVNVNEGFKDEACGPHLALIYPPPDERAALLEDAASLIIHHVKRQSNTSKEDKRTMKFLVRTVIQDIFMADRFPMSDDEDEDDEEEDEEQDDEDAEGEDHLQQQLSDRRAEDEDDTGADESSWRTRQSRPSKPKRSAEARRGTLSNADYVCEAPRSTLRGGGGPGSSGQSNPASQSVESADHEASDADKTYAACTRDHRSFDSHACGRVAGALSANHMLGFPKEECYSLLYGNNSWYAFFRLHHLLLSRLHILRSRSLSEAMQAHAEKQEAPLQAAEVLRLRRYGGIDPADYYNRALSLVKDLLDGGEDLTTYEDRLRDMFGIYAYPWFTLDRLVINIVRQLQILASGDDLSRRLNNLYRSWSMTAGNSCFTSHQATQTSSGIRGPLYTRACRISAETDYRLQALSVCSEFAVHGNSALLAGVATAGANGTNTASLVVNQSACGHVSGDGNATTSGQPVCLPNCYMLIMLAEASTMLIRLVEPSRVYYQPDSEVVATDRSYSSVPLGSHTLSDGTSVTGPSSRPGSPHLTVNRRAVPVDRNRDVGLNRPAKRWCDYLSAHFKWSLGYVPVNIEAHVRPVFLYRTVRRCVRILTNTAHNERKRQRRLLVSSDAATDGDDDNDDAEIVQQEQQGTVSAGSLPTESRDSQTNVADVALPSSNLCFGVSSAVCFERDVWEFMRHVFKSDISRKELFRDTFSSDYMQSTDRIVTKSPNRTHKIKWSVGSYGIFVRSRRRAPMVYLSTEKWRIFDAQCLRKSLGRTAVEDDAEDSGTLVTDALSDTTTTTTSTEATDMPALGTVAGPITDEDADTLVVDDVDESVPATNLGDDKSMADDSSTIPISLPPIPEEAEESSVVVDDPTD